MMTLTQLRKKYAAASPCDALDDLAMVINHPKKENFRAPVTTIVMVSGHSFKGYLLSASGPEEAEKSYIFAQELENSSDGANDLIYVQGHRIESVTVWNVEDYSGILPRFLDKTKTGV